MSVFRSLLKRAAPSSLQQTKQDPVQNSDRLSALQQAERAFQKSVENNNSEGVSESFFNFVFQ